MFWFINWICEQLCGPFRFDCTLSGGVVNLAELRSLAFHDVTDSDAPHVGVAIIWIVAEIDIIFFFLFSFIWILRYLEFWWNLCERWRIRLFECGICRRCVFIGWNCWGCGTCNFAIWYDFCIMSISLILWPRELLIICLIGALPFVEANRKISILIDLHFMPMQISFCCTDAGAFLLPLFEGKLLIGFPHLLGYVILPNLLLFENISILIMVALVVTLAYLLLLLPMLFHQYLFSGQIWKTLVFLILLILVHSELWYLLPCLRRECVIHYHAFLSTRYLHLIIIGICRACWIGLRVVSF